MSSKLVNIQKIGKIPYLDSLRLQNKLVDLHRSNEKEAGTLLLVEHPPVYTTGIRTKDYTLQDEKELLETGAEFYRTNRGGLITFHGPGQLVVYPILNLKHFKASMRWYICHLEKTVIDLCKSFALKGETSPHTGVWIGDNKVCAIGVHGSRFITSHGLALNCCTNLEWYRHIVPCGIEHKGVTSLSKELNRHVSIDEVIPLFLISFSKIFNCKVVDLDSSVKAVWPS